MTPLEKDKNYVVQMLGRMRDELLTDSPNLQQYRNDTATFLKETCARIEKILAEQAKYNPPPSMKSSGVHKYFDLQKTAMNYSEYYFNSGCYVEFKYKGHEICVEEDDDGDVIKRIYHVKTPDGRYLSPNVSPYWGGEQEVKDWIDKGCPKTK